MARITEMQQKFADHYVRTGNGALSARRAGYGKGAAVRACNLLKKPDIQKAIRTQQIALQLESGVSKSFLMQKALKAHEAARNTMEELRAIDRMAHLCGYY